MSSVADSLSRKAELLWTASTLTEVYKAHLHALSVCGRGSTMDGLSHLTRANNDPSGLLIFGPGGAVRNE